MCCWSKGRNIDQFNRIETHIYNQLAFNADAKIIQWVRNTVFSKLFCDNENPHAKEYNWMLPHAT